MRRPPFRRPTASLRWSDRCHDRCRFWPGPAERAEREAVEEDVDGPERILYHSRGRAGDTTSEAGYWGSAMPLDGLHETLADDLSAPGTGAPARPEAPGEHPLRLVGRHERAAALRCPSRTARGRRPRRRRPPRRRRRPPAASRRRSRRGRGCRAGSSTPAPAPCGCPARRRTAS